MTNTWRSCVVSVNNTLTGKKYTILYYLKIRMFHSQFGNQISIDAKIPRDYKQMC